MFLMAPTTEQLSRDIDIFKYLPTDDGCCGLRPTNFLRGAPLSQKKNKRDDQKVT